MWIGENRPSRNTFFAIIPLSRATRGPGSRPRASSEGRNAVIRMTSFPWHGSSARVRPQDAPSRSGSKPRARFRPRRGRFRAPAHGRIAAVRRSVGKLASGGGAGAHGPGTGGPLRRHAGSFRPGEGVRAGSSSVVRNIPPCHRRSIARRVTERECLACGRLALDLLVLAPERATYQAMLPCLAFALR